METIQSIDKHGIMNLMLDALVSKRTLKRTLCLLKNQLASANTLLKLTACLALTSSIHHGCKTNKAEMIDLVNDIITKMDLDEDNQDVDIA